MMSNVKRFFDDLLPILWLRPESALWYSYMLATAYVFPLRFDSPSMEFGCMDGINTYLLLGGKIDEKYDAFQEVQWHVSSHREASLENDYYDRYNPTSVVPITKVPSLQLDFGVDWKNSHLEKARRLCIYRSLTKIDLSSPRVSNCDNSLETIWAPNLYWTPNILITLKELRRVLRENTGSLFTILPDISQLDYMIYNSANEKNKDWLQLIDRGRFINVATNAKTLDGWISTFESSGFHVVKHRGFMPEIVARVYDIGFRPMFPVFMNVYKTLSMSSGTELYSLKNEWVERIQYLLSPLLDLNESGMADENHAWHMFEVKRT